MKIGVPKEIKPQEARVGLTPAGALSIIEAGHEVRIQNDAGLLSGFTNESYEQVGCIIENDLSAIYEFAEMIIKVKEPISEEYNLIKPNQLLFTYFHFASSKKLTDAMIQSKAICLAYETVEDNGKLPLLIPMSEVAGRMATQEGAKYLEKPQGGFGILLGGVTGVKPANIMVIGGGVAGAEAALMGAGLGANVTIFDTNLDRLRYLESNMPANVTPIFSNQYSLEKEIKRAPKLIKKEMLSKMMPGTVLVDVAIDQGGCFETSEPTTHEKPIIIKEGIIHYAVTNMPGAVPNTSTTALTNATLNYALELANKGWKKACKDNNALARGLNIINGEVVYKEVADAFSLDYVELESIL